MTRTLWRSNNLYLTFSHRRFSIGLWAYSYTARAIALELTLGPLTFGYDALGDTP